MNPDPKPTCTWIEDYEGVWSTRCGEATIFEVLSPDEHRYKFCCWCGKPLEAVKFVHEEIADE